MEPTVRQEEYDEYLSKLPKTARLGSHWHIKTYAAWGYEPPGLAGQDCPKKPPAPLHHKDQLAGFAPPDPQAQMHAEKLAEKVQALHAEGFAAAAFPPHLGGELFETAQRLRGFETFCIDLVHDKKHAHALLDRLTEVQIECARVIAASGADLICLDDDIGAPTHMLMSPATWAEFFQPRLKQIIEAAKSQNDAIKIFYHSDGWYEPVIPGLIEIGVDVIEPVQPNYMDPAALKKSYGDSLSFWGAVGTPTLWAHGSPQDIKDEVKRRIDQLAPGGGYVCGNAFDLEPWTPWESIVAFSEAASEFGHYRA
jgi:uroporphyrinogen decarboxylase